MSWRLVCRKCGYQHHDEEYVYRCPRCGAPLEIEGQLPRPKYSILGEGETPLVRIGGFAYKLEYLNPTGSFKDRGSALSVWLAERLDYKCVVEDSSGNTGISVAAYAARLGLRARIHVPKTSGRGKLNIIRMLGAELVIHDDRSEATVAAIRDSEKCFYVAHLYSPVFLEGITSIAGELVGEDVASMPIYVPTSSGTLLLGIYRGMKRYGVKPYLVAVQSPLAASLRGRVPLAVESDGDGRMLDALVVRDPPRLEEMVEAASSLAIIGDSAARKALKSLYSKGFIVEPSSAVVEAAATLMGVSSAVLVLTGSGLKYAESL